MVLILTQPAPAFGANAHRGEWSGREVVALLGPEVEGAVEASRDRAEPFIGLERRGVWPLIDVVAHEGRAAWLYPLHRGTSLISLLVKPPPMRVCLELALAVLDRLEDFATEGLTHPGPLPEDVWVDAAGKVSLLSFVGPSLPSASRKAPNAGLSEAADGMYRFGVLACELLGGEVAGPGATDDDQRTVQRRAAIRMMSRPGPVLDEAARNEIVRCLAFDPEERPSIETVRSALTTATAALQQPSLEQWAAWGLAEHLGLTASGARTTLEVATWDLLTDAMHTSTEMGFIDDDVTAVSAGSCPDTCRHVELGSIPVTVGPPPELARMRPTLPPDLFDEPVSVAPEPAPIEASPGAPPTGRAMRTLMLVSVVLIVVALALAAYLF